jgi:hypothetical protein
MLWHRRILLHSRAANNVPNTVTRTEYFWHFDHRRDDETVASVAQAQKHVPLLWQCIMWLAFCLLRNSILPEQRHCPQPPTVRDLPSSKVSSRPAIVRLAVYVHFLSGEAQTPTRARCCHHHRRRQAPGSTFDLRLLTRRNGIE